MSRNRPSSLRWLARPDLDFYPMERTIGGEWPYERREDGTWYDPETGKDCVTMSLEEFLKQVRERK